MTENVQSTHRHWVETAKLIATWMLALFVFIVAYSRILFVILMSEYDFFSYDIFDAGGFGMTVFYATTELMIVVSGLALFGIFIPLASGLRNGRMPWSEFGFFLLLNTSCALLLIIFSLRAANKTLEFC